ncbi:hypothetical protein KM031_02080 [Gemmobacter fulvus]|uniref:Uncharacterized protein n=1 Tax=Gemmobacter fulvus TaxID=2840474 RepID=A0A975S115_9RHOB|nr:hypothetical protein [Gemmobacter fulvus]MBT9244922.1 hypothetical protein [Gemmobacter fulvus]QWK90724.1 hypothetical protein KM031_02080 [Gemmobacter fulvus]
MNIAEKIAELAPKVAAFVARNRQPRPLTQDERRLAVSDPEKFDSLVQSLQAETIELIRAEAAHGVLQEDLAREQAAERARQAAIMVAEREELLALRHEASLEVDAALADADASLVSFQEISAKIASLDRQLGEGDRNRASYGMMALGLKRSIRDKAPALWKLTGGRMTGQGSNNGLSDMSRPANYDLAARLGEPDPLG